MGQLKFEGTITVGPVVKASGQVPSSVSTVDLESQPSPKSSAVDTGFSTRQINSSGDFVTLGSIGADGDVTRADTLYFRSTSPMRVRVTFADTPDDVVAELVLQGTLVIEAPPSPNYIKLVEVKGVGTIEYLASGQQ
jgi:hypothetical protein